MISKDRMREIDRRVHDRYVLAAGQRDAYRNDPQYHATVQTISRWMFALDESMAAEGCDEPVRDRVMYRLLYEEAPGGIEPPDFREAHNRLADRLEARMRMMSQPLTTFFQEDQG